MDITESLLTALTLLGLGMAFVFIFLGLLYICIGLMEKFVPADELISAPKRKTAAASKPAEQVSPQVIAAITSAVQQYRKVPAA